MTHKVLIGIGSNLGSPQENCKKAISLLYELESISILKQSSLYQSEPIGKKNQPWFVNAAIEIQTTLSPESLLQTLLNIEQQMGRTRRGRRINENGLGMGRHTHPRPIGTYCGWADRI